MIKLSNIILVSNLIPSKLPLVIAKLSKDSYVSSDGLNTKTPELKQSGQPASGAADNSSLSKSSSTFCKTWKKKETVQLTALYYMFYVYFSTKKC